MKHFWLYMHIAPNGKVYIGKTTRKRPEMRWGSDGRGYKTQQYFWRAIQYWEWKNFTHYTWEMLTKEAMNEGEKAMIAFFNARNPEYGYNCTEGGEGVSGFSMSDDTKKLMSDLKHQFYEDNPNAGKEHGEQLRQLYANNPEKGQEISIRMTEFYSDPVNRENDSKRMKKFYAEHPEVIEKQKAGREVHFDDPAWIRRASDGHRSHNFGVRKYEDPVEYRYRMRHRVYTRDSESQFFIKIPKSDRDQWIYTGTFYSSDGVLHSESEFE